MNDAEEIKKAVAELRTEMHADFRDVKARLAELEKWRTFLGGVIFAATTIGGAIAWLWHELRSLFTPLKP
jgi:hypothetical protein